MKRLLNRSKNGLTLVEMLVVLAIIGMLFTWYTPNISGIFNSAKEDLIKADCRTFELGLTQAMLDSEGFTALNDTSSNSLLIYFNQYLNGNIRFERTDVPYEYKSGYRTPYDSEYVLKYDTAERTFTLVAHKTLDEVAPISLKLKWDNVNKEVKSTLYE